MNLFRAISAAVVVVAADLAVAGEPTAANDLLRVRVDPATRRLTLSAVGQAAPFAVSGPLSADGAGVRQARVSEPAFGPGEALEVTLGDGHWLQVAVYPGLPFALFRRVLVNGAAVQTVNRIPYEALALELGVPAASLTVLGTGGPQKAEANPGSYMWTAVADPATRRGVVAGWLTTDRGSGVVRTDVVEGALRLLPHVDYGRLRLEPGQREPLETFAVGLFGDARLGLEAYADAIAKVYDIHLPPMPTVHCTWYVDGSSNAAVLTARTEFAARALAPFGLSVMQIDDGWQLGATKNGPRKVFLGHNPQGPYPTGMEPMADTIRQAGLVAGLWLIPFAGSSDDPWFADKADWFARKPDGTPYDTTWGGTCLDLTRPDTQAHLTRVIRTLTHDWGYRYLKMDGLYTGAAVNLNYVCDTFREDEIGQAVLADPGVTQVQMMRNSLRLVREAAGDDVFLLGCCAPQNMRSAGAAFGRVHAMRIGPDNGANWTDMQRGPEWGAWQYFLHGRVWYNDPDPLYVRPSLPLEHARVIASWVALTGAVNSSSEEYAGLPADRLDLLRRTMPAHHGVARPLDLFEHRVPGVWQVTDTASGVRRDVLGLFNWESREQAFDLALTDLGLPADADLVGFEFWSRALTAPFRGRLTSSLPPQSCAVFAIRPLAGHPLLLSTSRHITQGLVDVRAETWDPARRVLSGVSAVVADDPYELRVLTWTTQGSWAAQPVSLSAADTAAGVRAEATAEEGLVRVVLRSPVSREVAWSVAFAEGQAAPIVPVATDLKAEMPDPDGPVVLTWRSTTRACEVRRDGEVQAPAATGGAWLDRQPRAGATCGYEVIPYTLAGGRGAAHAVTFAVPALPQLGPVPPKPDVRVDALEPVAQAVGWGTFRKGVALNGPLRLGAETFTSGVCIHADGYAVYRRDPAWTRFVAVVGIDESQRPQNQSSIVFRVAVEAAGVRRELARSPVLRFGKRERWHFDVELPADAERVVLVSDAAGDGIKSDHGDWCEAGFVR